MPARGREWSAATAVGLVLARRTAPKVETSGAAVCCPLVERLVVTVYGTRESTGARRRGPPHSRAPSTTPDQTNNFPPAYHHLKGCHPVSLCQYVGTLGAPQTRQKAVLHEACHSARWLGSPPGGAREGTLSCRHRGCTCQSFEATIQFLYWLLWHPASDHFPKENNVKLTLVLCGAALRGSGSQQRSGREATTNALRCGQRQQRQAQQGQTQHV